MINKLNSIPFGDCSDVTLPPGGAVGPEVGYLPAKSALIRY